MWTSKTCSPTMSRGSLLYTVPHNELVHCAVVPFFLISTFWHFLWKLISSQTNQINENLLCFSEKTLWNPSHEKNFLNDLFKGNTKTRLAQRKLEAPRGYWSRGCIPNRWRGALRSSKTCKRRACSFDPWSRLRAARRYLWPVPVYHPRMHARPSDIRPGMPVWWQIWAWQTRWRQYVERTRSRNLRSPLSVPLSFMFLVDWLIDFFFFGSWTSKTIVFLQEVPNTNFIEGGETKLTSRKVKLP